MNKPKLYRANPLLFLIGNYLLILVSSGFLQAQDETLKLVILNENREKMVQNAGAILNSEDPEFYTSLRSALSPFIQPEEEPVEEEADTGVVADNTIRPKPQAKPKDLSNEVILRSVAGRLNPKGSLVTSRRSLLLFPNGGKLTVGDVIPTNSRGKEYKIVVSAITPNSYTLRLNEAEITKSFKITTSKDSVISRDSGNN